MQFKLLQIILWCCLW